MSSLQVTPDGYKQTEVGMIPEDWDVSPLNEVCSFGGGTTPPRAQHDRYFVNGSNNWVKTTDLNNSLIDVSEEQITDLALSETGLKKHPVGSVLVAMYGGFNQIGRTGYLTKPSAINQALVAVKPKPKKINSYYLLSELNYKVDYWKGVASSSRKDPNITSNDVKNYVIALPSIEEQNTIANALSDVDALLGELEKLIAKKQAIKTATMQQLLTGKTRLPQFATYADGDKEGQVKGTKTTELGEIPEDWDVEKVNGFTDCTAGGTPSTKISSYWGGNNPWMSSGELHLKRVYDVAERITDIGLESSSTKYIPKDSVLMGLAGQGKTRGTVAISKITLCTNQSIAAIFPSEKHSTDYLYYNLDHRYEELRGLSTGDGGRGGLNLSIIRNLKIPFPKLEEQSAIAITLSDMDEEIQALKQRLSKTRQIKQGMMQELLTGKTRLPFEKGDTKSQGEPDAN
ncbi:restriction endonuclease subunit S [Vibrio coralliirubri]|uniref:restriction endonuclease subunit S n=1 Tax=Vibrio TaxID=662 RepID=UPI002FD203D0